MRKLATIIVVSILILLALPALFRKRAIPLVFNGKVVAIATRPFVMPWNDNDFSVYANGTKLFAIWGDFFNFPIFIYPFADGKRFLCVDDDDTCVLVFVVDFSSQPTNAVRSFGWPPDGYTRNYMAGRSTNVVMDTKGYIRLPNFNEVQEASSNLMTLSPGQLNTVSFPIFDVGVYRSYWPREVLLSELATNRESAWPLIK